MHKRCDKNHHCGIQTAARKAVCQLSSVSGMAPSSNLAHTAASVAAKVVSAAVAPDGDHLKFFRSLNAEMFTAILYEQIDESSVEHQQKYEWQKISESKANHRYEPF